MSTRLGLVILAAALAAPVSAQGAWLSVEAGGGSAAITLNAEWPVAGPLSVRAGVGTLPAVGVRLAVPVGLRYAVDAGPVAVDAGAVAVEVGAGGLVAALSSDYLFTPGSRTSGRRRLFRRSRRPRRRSGSGSAGAGSSGPESALSTTGTAPTGTSRCCRRSGPGSGSKAA